MREHLRRRRTRPPGTILPGSPRSAAACRTSPPPGRKAGPDPLWHVGRFSEGAGFSSVFARPGYQNGVAAITGSRMRSVPDITMDAQDGTSQAAPLFAGVLALATQLNHANVGPVNPALYGILGPAGARAGIADVVKGNNSAPKVTGFTAGRGFDVASGWGTINASRFVPEPGRRHPRRESGVFGPASGRGGAEPDRARHPAIPWRHPRGARGVPARPGVPARAPGRAVHRQRADPDAHRQHIRLRHRHDQPVQAEAARRKPRAAAEKHALHGHQNLYQRLKQDHLHFHALARPKPGQNGTRNGRSA